MKRILVPLLMLTFITVLFAQGNYFDAFMKYQKAKRYLNSNPQKAEMYFNETYNILRVIVKRSIKEDKPSSNAMKILGDLYLNGWGVAQNKQKAIQLLCASQKYGNFRAKQELKKLNVKCKKTTLKELEQ